MEFLAAKCPNCGGDLRLPDDKKSVKCMYCSFDIIVRDAVNAGANVENLLKLATKAAENNNHQEAYDYFTKVLEYEPENYYAILGKGVAAGYLSTPINFRYEELQNAVREAIEKAPEEEKEGITRQSAQYLYEVACKYSSSLLNTVRTDEDSIRTLKIIQTFKFAHNYAPDDEAIIEMIIMTYNVMNAQERLLNLKYQTDSWNESIESNKKEQTNYISKLQILNPEKANSLAEQIRERNPLPQSKQEVTVAPIQTGGCLIVIITLLVISIFLFAVSI